MKPPTHPTPESGELDAALVDYCDEIGYIPSDITFTIARWAHSRDARQVDELRAENDRLKEALSYLPKVPTQPYEREMAQEIARLTEHYNELLSARAEIRQLKASEARLAEALEVLLDSSLANPDGPGDYAISVARKALRAEGE